jgi:GT2 family glycosyltransferase
MPSLTVVIVTHNSRDGVAHTLPALAAQLRADDELIVVDNESADGTVESVAELAPSAQVIETGDNLGFAAACNQGAERGTGELLCLLNPDAVPQPGWRDAIERPAVESRGWAAWQGLVTSNAGRTINTRGGVVHFTGIAWAGGAGLALADLPASESVAAGEPAFVSGACLAIPRETYLELGGMPPEFFLYHEDVDLSLRLRLGGGRLGVEPAARVDHEYDFEKGPAKWRYLERNRWATVLRTYPGPLLFLLLPGLAATDLALIVISIRGGWFKQKLLAWLDTWRRMPRLLRERRAVQATREISAAQFAAALTPELDSAYLGAASESRLLGGLLRAYWRLVTALLRG